MTPTQHLLSKQEIDAITNQAREHEWTSHQHAHAIVAAAAAKLAQGVELEVFQHFTCDGCGRQRIERSPIRTCPKCFYVSSHSGEYVPLSTAQAAVAAERAKGDLLRKGLQFYADRDHFILSDETAWDTVSGEPQNWWCDEAGTATVEDGSVAKLALAGTDFDLGDEDEPASPAPAAEPAPMAVLCELVALQDLQDEVHGIEFAGPGSAHGDTWKAVAKEKRCDYIRRAGLAWAAARVCVATPSSSPAVPAVPADRAGLVEECIAAANEQSAVMAGLMLVQEGDQEGNVRLLDRCRRAVEATHAAIDRLASAPAQVAECGHPASMVLKSAENGRPLYCEACDDKSSKRDAEQMETELRVQAQVWRKAVQEAYGWLWHVNNEPAAPVPLWSPDQAAYKARQSLRELLTHQERGEAINAVRGLIHNIAVAAPAAGGGHG